MLGGAPAYLHVGHPGVQEGHVGAHKGVGQDRQRVLELVVGVQPAQVPQEAVEDHDAGADVARHYQQVLEALHQRERLLQVQSTSN